MSRSIAAILPIWASGADVSIVVQGGLHDDSLVAVARNCHHWRSGLPDAEIILAISSTDLLAPVSPGILTRLPPAPRVAADTQVVGALRMLEDCCDAVVLAEPALPLPPIKADTDRSNNVNLQIAAAKAGLAQCTRPYTLRLRNDLVLDAALLLDRYRSVAGLARPAEAWLAQRVAISSIYTVNPYSFEGLPFHFSDWFHFGLTADLRGLWNVAQMSLADATFHQHAAFRDGSSFRERLFNTRLAVEQHLTFLGGGCALPHAMLDYHNDHRSRASSLDYLCDNFLVCDPRQLALSLPRYARELLDPYRTEHCLSAATWEALVHAPATERPAIALAAAPPATPVARPFPRFYPATTLSVPGEGRWQREIAASDVTAVLAFGPYDTLPAGAYVASVHTSILTGPGTVLLRATANRGRDVLAESAHEIDGVTQLDIDFDVPRPQRSGIEIAVQGIDLAAIAITGITIAAIDPERLEAVSPSSASMDEEGIPPPSVLLVDSPPPGRSRRALPRLARWLSRRLTPGRSRIASGAAHSTDEPIVSG